MPTKLRISILGLTLALGASSTATAQDQVASFYRGKTMQAVVGYTPGSTFELYLRMFVRHLERHVPGQPNIVVILQPERHTMCLGNRCGLA